MVGVPRSKGCRICVQRRVKCDLAKPTCNNCKKGNRPCPGYNQDLKFQDEGVRLRRRFQNHESPSTGTESSRDSSDSPPDATNTGISSSDACSTSLTTNDNGNNNAEDSKDHTSDHWDVVGLDMNKSQRRTFLGLLEGKSEAYAALGETMPEYAIDDAYLADTQDPFFLASFDEPSNNPFYNHVVSPHSVQNALVTTFSQSLYPDNNTLPKYLKNHTRWLAHLPPLTGSNKLLDASVRAVTLVHIGRLNNSEPFVMESRPYYGQALHLLNKALQDRVQGMQNETLCAVILLSFYEMFASDNNESWVRHAGGVSALMRARGPARHRHGLDREIFLAYRYMLIVESFNQDVPCFLAEPEWQQLSRKIHADLKDTGISPERMAVFDLAEDFYQAMVILPAQSRDARAIWAAQQSGSQPPCSRAQMIESLTKSRIEFKSTFAQFDAALQKAGSAPTLRMNSKDPLFSVEYDFLNTFASATYTGYWTVLIVLNMCLQVLQAKDRELVEMYKTESQECAVHICRATACMLTSSFLGPFFIIFGLRVSLMIFEDMDRPETDWILRKLFEIGDRHMGIAKHIPGYRAGITVNELIAEFKARNAASKQNNNMSEQMEFKRQVTHGLVNGSEDEMNDESSNTRIHFGNLNGDWQGMNQTDEVLNAWDNQDNFPIHEMSNLNVMSDGTGSGQGSQGTSPMPMQYGGTGGASSVAFAMPDMDFWDPGWEDEIKQQQQQTPAQSEVASPPQMPRHQTKIGIERFFYAAADKHGTA